MDFRKITIQSSEVTGTHSDFPVMIYRATDAGLEASARSDGYDILFTKDDKLTKIPHEIELFDDSNGNLVAWVKPDSISDAADTDPLNDGGIRPVQYHYHHYFVG